jgi:hypothetical protein
MIIFISIVSHGHQAEIIDGGLLDALDGLGVAVRENKPDKAQRINWQTLFFQNLRCNGFGANHNKTFESLNLADADWFVICNPDILTDGARIKELVEQAEADGERIAVPYLYNKNNKQFDHNVRPWPTFINLARAFFKLGGRSRYSETEISRIRYPDWASGALMAIKAETFRVLNGFDETYFMYMEDVDLCQRAARLGIRVRFYNNITMVHNAARASNRLFSTNLRHHLISAVRYFWKYRGAMGRL